ncbi:MAG: multiple sugar transport system permease protein [Kosmotogales bacterium]|nr:multiple sugar transport system permease protein [Kosmotogales bacterium]
MRRKSGFNKLLGKTLFYIIVVGIAFIILLPIYFILSISFMSDQEAYDWPINMYPTFTNSFKLEESRAIESGYLLSVYSNAQKKYVTIFEGEDVDEILHYTENKTNCSIPKDLFLEKAEEMRIITEKNRVEIDQIYLKIDSINTDIRKINSDITKLRKNLKLVQDQESMQDMKIEFEKELNEKELEKTTFEKELAQAQKDLESLNSTNFSIFKNIFANYVTFFQVTADSLGALFRSIQVALLTVLISLTIGGMAGYAFARYVFKGKNVLKLSVLFVRMFPGIAIAMPMVIILANMGFYDKPIGLSFVYSVGQIGLTTWITASVFMGIPVELEEAAMVFGRSKIGAFLKVTLPLALPGLAASALYSFIGSWAETAQAIVLTQFNPTFPVVVYQTMVGAKGMVNLIAAGGITMALPAVLFTLIIRKYILQMWGGVTV